MNLVSELDLPVFDYTAPDFSADRYHQQLAETRQQGWLAKSPLAYIYGIDKLPIIWSGSSKLSPNHGLAPDVS
ncbi:MAG: hypothetical protein WBF34_24845 [Streptosporangiaceae bacterium]|jgi:hypothetical protein